MSQPHLYRALHARPFFFFFLFFFVDKYPRTESLAMSQIA